MSMKSYLQAQIQDAGVIEVRHLPSGQSARFDNAGILAEVISSKTATGGLYTTLNRPYDKTTIHTFGRHAFKDADMLRIVRLPFDFDPVRATGTASTDEQLSFARERAQGLIRKLHGEGWPMPLTAMSGNGYHLQYRTALPADQETKEMLALIYRGLSQQFSDDLVEFDTTVRNPSRVLRLYGTTNRKGQDPDFWRQSLCKVPRQWRQVRPRQIERFAERFAKKPVPIAPRTSTALPVTGKGDYSTLDVVRWFQSLGLYEDHIDGNTHAVTCPWEDEHSQQSPNDTVIFDAEGSWPGFFCHHSHCDGRNIRDVISLFGNADSFCGQSWGGRHVSAS